MTITERERPRLYYEAFMVCAAIRAMQAVQVMHAEYGAIERLEKDLDRRSKDLGHDVQVMWTKYEDRIITSERTKVESHIRHGRYDSAVINRAQEFKIKFFTLEPK